MAINFYMNREQLTKEIEQWVKSSNLDVMLSFCRCCINSIYEESTLVTECLKCSIQQGIAQMTNNRKRNETPDLEFLGGLLMSADRPGVSPGKAAMRSGNACPPMPGLRFAGERQVGHCGSTCTTEITQQEVQHDDSYEMVDGPGVHGRGECCRSRKIVLSSST